MNGIITKVWNAIEAFMKIVVYKLFRLKISEEVWNNLMQFVKFGIVGVSNTVIGYLIYAITLFLLRSLGLWASVDIFIAQFVMFVLSVAWSFYWNDTMVFKKEENEKRNIWLALLKTYISYAFTSLLLSEILLMLWVNVLGINEYVAPVLSLLITVPLNFVIQKFWAFKGKKKEVFDTTN